MSLFDLNAVQGGKDALNFKAVGDVLSFEAQVNNVIANANTFDANRIKIGANFGAFSILSGFNADGEAVASFRITKDAGNWDGQFFETFKPGSIFSRSYANFSINQVNIGGGGATGIGGRATGLGFQDREFFLQMGFNFAIPNSDASFRLLGTVISDRAWNSGGNDDDYITVANPKYNDGHLAYTVFAIFSKPSIFNAQAFIKMSPHCLGCDRDQVFVPGAYVEVTAIKNLDIMGGFTMSIVEGTYEDYAFDLRARYAITNALSLTYYGNVSVANGDVSTSVNISKELGPYGNNVKPYVPTYAYTTSVAGTPVATTAQTLASQIFMWNYLHAKFQLSDGIAAHLGIGAITDLANGINEGPQKGEGTELSVTPAATFYASKNASIDVGFNVTFRGIGKEEHPVAITDKDDANWTGDTTATQQGLDVAFSIPVLFRVKM
jgi:hypothetical protein